MFRSYMSIHFWYNCGCFSSVFTRLHPLLQSDIPVWCGHRMNARLMLKRHMSRLGWPRLRPTMGIPSNQQLLGESPYWAQEGLPVKDGLKAVSTVHRVKSNCLPDCRSTQLISRCFLQYQSSSLHPLLQGIEPEASLSSSPEFGVHSCAFLLFIVWGVVFK